MVQTLDAAAKAVKPINRAAAFPSPFLARSTEVIAPTTAAAAMERKTRDFMG
jgi:hypothetical protein